MEIIGRFGLNPVLLVAQIVNFLIIGYVLWRLALRPLVRTMDARKAKISQGLEDAEKARRALENAEKERERIRDEAHREASRILANTRVEAEKLREGELRKAREDAERMIAEAHEQIALERREMETEVRRLALDLSGSILNSVVASLFSEEEKGRIMSRGVERIRTLG